MVSKLNFIVFICLLSCLHAELIYVSEGVQQFKTWEDWYNRIMGISQKPCCVKQPEIKQPEIKQPEVEKREAKKPEPKRTTVAIIGTNDIHGSAFPKSLVNEITKEEYKYGGLVYMARLMQIIKSQFPNTLYLDAGDQFQGGLQSSDLISSGEIMNDFYNTMQLEGASIGNHQFDFGPQFLLPYLKGRQTLDANLAANLRSEKNEENFLPNQKGSKIMTLPSGIKIGIIGLSTIQTPSATDGFSSGKFPEYKFLDYKPIVIDHSKKLRAAGANAILIVSHVGDYCNGDINYRRSWLNTTEQEACTVDQITKLVNSLPEGTIDGIVQGHRHVFAHNFINNVAYMGVINGGYYFNTLYLTFDENNKIVNKTIEGPVPVCEKVFSNIGRCNYLTGQELKQAGNLINWKFHGQDVYAHKELDEVYQRKWVPLMEQYLVPLATNEVYLERSRESPSQLGNLITSLIHQAVPDADFVLLNAGGFRTQWIPGILQEQHFYGMFPFDNDLVSFEMTGQQLLDTLPIIQSGRKGFYHFWNIFTEVTYNPKTNQKQYISGRMQDGTEIEPARTYKGVTIPFLLDGGDDFSKVIGIVYTPRNVQVEGDFKNLVREQLKALGTIKKDVWANPPRIVVTQVQ